MRKSTTEEFIRRAKEIFGNRYDYSLVEYAERFAKIKIICRVHGVFEQTPGNHLQKHGCVKCNLTKLKRCFISNTKDFIDKSNAIYNFKYDYSLVKYNGNKNKVKIICREHGEFEQSPVEHYAREGCSKCRFSITDFIRNSNLTHNMKYDYSLVEYINADTKVTITCKEHGEFKQLPNSHSSGNGCPKCGIVKNGETHRSNLGEFVEKANKVHDFKYSYENVEYILAREKVSIICHEHGIFWQNAESHLRGRGCPKCKKSKGHTKVRNILENLLIKYEEEYKFEECRYKRCLPFDFSILINNSLALIEYQGIQHYIPISFGSKRATGEQKFEIYQERDNIKKKYCIDNNIPLLCLKYDEDHLMEEKIKVFIDSIGDRDTQNKT